MSTASTSRRPSPGQLNTTSTTIDPPSRKPNCTEKICISTMPSANAGNEMPETASVMPTRSGQRLRHTADSIPIARPNTTDHTMLVMVSQNVGMKRSPISVATSRFVRSERPKSPRTAPVAKRTNCSGSGRSSPRSLRTSETVSGVASGPAARRAGSPGSRCRNMNTSTATIRSVGTRPARRLAMNWSMGGRGGNAKEAVVPANAGTQCRSSKTLDSRVRGNDNREPLLQVDLGEIERRIRNHVDTGKLLVVCREQPLGDQRRPRRVLVDRLLRVLVQLRLLVGVGRELRVLDVAVDLRVLVVGGVEEPRRPRFPAEQRSDRPVRFAGRRRPADVVQTYRRGRRILPALDLLHALTRLEQRDLRADADLLELLLKELRDLLRGAVVVRRPQLGLEAVRIAGFGHQLLRLRDIVGPRADLHRVLHTIRNHALRRLGVAVERDLRERVLVDRVRDRLAHLRVVERLLLRVHRKVAQHDRRRGDDLEVRLALQHVGELVRNREREVCFAGLHHRRTRVVVDDRLPRDRVDLRVSLAPIAVELRDLEVIGRLPFDELERPGADRVERDVLVAILLERGRADHHRGRMRELVDERRERCLECDARRVIVDRLGHRDVVVVQAVALELVVRIGHAIEAHLDGLGLEVGAVVEFHALAQLDRVDEAVGAHRIALGEHRDHLHVLVEAEQALVERLRHRLRQRVVRVVRIGRRERGSDSEHDILGGERGAGGERGQRERAGGEGTQQRFHRDLLWAVQNNGLLEYAAGSRGYAHEHAAQYWPPTRCVATKCPGPTATSGATTGSSPTVRIGLGTSSDDSSNLRCRRAGSAIGTASISLRVYGCCGFSNTARRGPISTICPRYMTATRWLTRSTTAMSCEMNKYESLSSDCRSSRRLTICAWIDTSSADTASSATMIFGLSASARAMAIRCR